MSYRLMTVALAAAGVMTLSDSALAQKKDPTTNALNLNSARSNNYRNLQTTPTGGTKAGKPNGSRSGGTVGYIPGTDTCIICSTSQNERGRQPRP
jgi:hypothetical protein